MFSSSRLRRRAVHLAVALALAGGVTVPFAHTAHAATSATQQLVADPGFEDGQSTTAWGQSQNANNGSYPLIVNYGNAHSGQWYADLCYVDNCVDQLTQAFTAPGQVTSATLSFYYEISTNESSGNSACHDHLQVGLGVNGGLDTNTFQQLCSQTSGYVQSSFDVTGFLNAHAGQLVDVILLGATDNLQPSEFFADDVTLNATYLTTPSAVTNISATSSAPSSATVSWTAPQFPVGSTPTSYTVTPYINSTAQSGLAQTVTQTNATFSTLTNASTYWFSIVATNANGSGPAASSYSVTPRAAGTPAPNLAVTSPRTSQYQLTNSDGATWQDMDGNNLTLSFTPSVSGEAVLTGNADLWTATAGVNQDMGLLLNNNLVAWKESGGAAAFAPNAAFVQSVQNVTQGTTYTLRLVWKTNQPALNKSIFAGAGGTGNFSPARLAVRFVTGFTGSGNPNGFAAQSPATSQYSLSASDGVTWDPIDSHVLAFSVTPAAAGTMVVSGNADLWTAQTGVNQDIGIRVNGATMAWKESGGGATFSPNAAYVVSSMPVAAGTAYNVELVWKANHSTSSTIFAAAGASGAFSPTSLAAIVVPTTSPVPTIMSPVQRQLSSSDGSTWQRMDGGDNTLALTFTTPNDSTNHTWSLGANADLWTSALGYNQDIGICWAAGASVTTCTGGNLLGWKESGGHLAAFSPNAAMLQTSMTLTSNTTYTFWLVWKANTTMVNASIFAGAGSPGNFSTTTLLAQIVQ